MEKYKICENHMFKKNGLSFFYDVGNLNVYRINDECAAAVEKLNHGADTAEINKDLIEQLVSAGILIDENSNEGQKDKLQYKSNRDVRNMVLELANDCNLNCKYCYGDGGSYGRKREMMSAETALRAVDFLVENSGNSRMLNITFFGGEPLLNFKVMKATVEYCKSIEENTNKKFTFTMTTNATILTDEIYEFIKKYNIGLTISIDGPKDVQDNYRCYVNGKGSYDVIIPNIKKLLDLKKGNIMARATICHPNLNLSDIFDGLTSMGFNSIALSPVDAKETSKLRITPEDFEIFNQEQNKMAEFFVEAMKNNSKYPYRQFFDVIERIYMKKKVLQPCGAGRGMIAVGTDGILYPCQRFMGMDEFSFGDIHKGITGGNRNKFLDTTVENKEGCSTCWARYLCGGGCPHTSAKANNTIEKAADSFCDSLKGLYELGFYMYCKLKDWDQDIFRKRFEKSETEKMENPAV
ncbi:MAG TPA: radical SAM protein [Ruminiclostridium sp.]|nr:radical SAM protein [Ruminiclostridium sp.]